MEGPSMSYVRVVGVDFLGYYVSKISNLVEIPLVAYVLSGISQLLATRKLAEDVWRMTLQV